MNEVLRGDEPEGELDDLVIDDNIKWPEDEENNQGIRKSGNCRLGAVAGGRFAVSIA